MPLFFMIYSVARSLIGGCHLHPNPLRIATLLVASDGAPEYRTDVVG